MDFKDFFCGGASQDGAQLRSQIQLKRFLKQILVNKIVALGLH
jgi:hypothetical protein